ncbi:MAG TPA: DNA internalization-related competence protein ComEC/Rec2 [Gammaproteobacteria bacterium]|nr:DNA internalization-related competence protein ComEC/Rec2 [Gammaproteobacteria bacterium]
MCSFALAFLCGVLLLQQFTVLPGLRWLPVIIVFVFLIEFFCVKKFKWLRYLSAILLGFSWTLFYVTVFCSWHLPHELEGKSLHVNGTIASIPNDSDNTLSFLFALKKIESEKVHATIKLSLRDENLKNVRVGDQWQFVVRLKRVHGLMNPGGFDYEAFALQEGIRANGYVIKSSENQLLESHWYHDFPDRIRQKLKDKVEANLPSSNTSPWIVALALGERQHISSEDWEILRNTGTNHLMAIAGLHIGCMASLAFFLVSFCWRRVPRLMLRYPAQLAGGLGALVMAFLYASLAGFSIPAERTCIMLSVVLIALILKRNMMSWQAWSIALFLMLLINPLVVLTDSFWLSFYSVALIIYGVSGRLNQQGWWWKITRVQWVITVGLIPVGVWLFQQISWTAFLANSIAIPWVAFLIVPLTLLGCFFLLFSAKAGGLILLSADKLLALLWQVLTYFSHLSFANDYMMIPNNGILLSACVGVIILLLPSGFPGKGFGVFWVLPFIFYHHATPRSGDVSFSLLDVGQGLSAVIQTHHHVLVFDAGPRFGANYDMGESVVAPYLRSLGVKKIDLLVVSHPDNDHIGGVHALFHYFTILHVKTSTPDKLVPFHADYCLRNDTWKWDGVTFKFLYPTSENLDLDNNSSCVLSVTNAYQKTILLTGDIEKFAENYLIQQNAKELSADILVAPHHGSKTSAIDKFVESVHPRYVLFPVGYRNRYHFPNASVVEKYQAINASLFETDRSGAIQFQLAEDITLPRQYRLVARRYWND